MKRLLAGVLAVVAVVLVTATPAFAHADLVRTDPAGSSTVDEAPREMTLTFSEPVGIIAGAVRVFDGAGRRVVVPPAKHATHDAATLVVPLPDLDDATYAVTWRVVSEDSHPIHGAFTFHVGAGGGTADDAAATALARKLVSEGGGSRSVGVLYGFVRFAMLIGLALVIGSVVFLAWVWPGGSTDRRASRLLWIGIVVAAFSTVASVAAQGAYGEGLGPTAILQPSLWSPVLGTRFGFGAIGRLALLAVAAVIATRRLPRQEAAILGLAVVGGLAVTTGLAGHAATGNLVGLALLVDAAHVAAIGIWLGGLAVLVLCVLRQDSTEDDPTPVVERFSQLALAAVAVIVVTGAFQAWRQVGSLGALTSTTYGRLLLVKVAVFAVLVGVAYLSRTWVRQRTAPTIVPGGPGAAVAVDHRTTISQLRRTVAAEVVLAVLMVAITAVLVNTVPARSALARPASVEIHTEDLLLDATVDPAKRGPADIHIYTLTHAGEVADVQDVTATLTLDSPPIGPLQVPLHKAGPGHYSAAGFELPLPGTWTLEITAAINDITLSTGSDTINVR